MRNSDYNARTFNIKTPSNVEELMFELWSCSYNVAGTKEFTNARIIMEDMGFNFSDYRWEALGSKVDEVLSLMKAILSGDDSLTTDIYDSKYYTFIKEEIDKARQKFEDDKVTTRRAVISFPSEHCFESIQVLIRNNTMHVTVNMRSCNAYKNLMSDLLLAYKIAIAIVVQTQLYNSIIEGSLVANIGSLHLFEEDFHNVL